MIESNLIKEITDWYGGWVMRILLLNVDALVAAVVLGVLLYAIAGLNALILMLVFLVAGVFVTKYDYQIKKELGIYEHERGWKNVLSNGIVPLAAAFLSPTIGMGAYVGAVAGIMSDKFGSELGVLSQAEPVSLATLKPAKKGTSGAVSAFGLLMCFDGALLIGLVASYLYGLPIAQLLPITLIGFTGSFADSVAGILEEQGFGTKETSNLVCAVVGAVLGWGFIKI